MESNQKNAKKWYEKWWVWCVIAIISIVIKMNSNNSVSPLLLIFGVIIAIISGLQLRKIHMHADTDNKEITAKKKKYIGIVLISSIAISQIGLFTLSVDKSIFYHEEKEKIINNIIVKGVNATSIPLSVSDLKLFKKGTTYTIVCNLRKASTVPEQGYFDFNIALIDKNGKYIKREHINTMPTSSNENNNMPLFSKGSTYPFEKELYISSDENAPTSIEFTDIKEFDKSSFIQTTLNKAKEYIIKYTDEQDTAYINNAKKCIDLIFIYEPDDPEAKSLLEQLSNAQNNLNTPTPTVTPAPTITPAPTEQVNEQDTQSENTRTNNSFLIGSDKENVRNLLGKYKETKSFMSDNALDFEDTNLLITVYFNSNDIADGVLFMQNNLDNVDMVTGIGSYTSKHYDELVKLATTDPNVKVESDYTKYNSKGVKKAPMEIYIGNVPH